MKKIMVFAILAVFLLCACAPAGEAEGTGIEIHDAWARSGFKTQNGVIYMLVHNHSESDDVILGASTDAADSAEIHLSQMNADGVMQMLPQPSVPLPADSDLEFAPGGYHIMLVNLKQDLKQGNEFMLIIHFQFHEDIAVRVPIYDAEMSGDNMDMNIHASPTP